MVEVILNDGEVRADVEGGHYLAVAPDDGSVREVDGEGVEVRHLGRVTVSMSRQARSIAVWPNPFVRELQSCHLG